MEKTKKPTLIVGRQGVGKTTKALELAGIVPGQDADKFGVFAGFNINFGVGMFHYKEFGAFRIVEEIIAASMLMAVWKKATHEDAFHYIAIVQTGAFALPEGIEDYFEIIDLDKAPTLEEGENNRRWVPLPTPNVKKKIIFFATSNDAAPVDVPPTPEEVAKMLIQSFDSFEEVAKDYQASRYSPDFKCPNCGAYSDHERTLIVMGDILHEEQGDDPGLSWPESHKCFCGQFYHYLNGA